MQIAPSVKDNQLTYAIVQDVFDWLETNDRFLSIIAKYSNATPEEVANLIRGKVINPKILALTEPFKSVKLEELIIIVKHISFDGTMANFNPFHSRIELELLYIQGLEAIPNQIDNSIYGGNRFQPNTIEPSTEFIFNTIKRAGFELAYCLIHEFIHYVGWLNQAPPQFSGDMFKTERKEKQSSVKNWDDYRVELCSRELYNFDWPYYQHAWFSVLGGIKNNRLRSTDMPYISGIAYEWDLSFRRFKRVLLSVMSSSKCTYDFYAGRGDYRSR